MISSGALEDILCSALELREITPIEAHSILTECPVDSLVRVAGAIREITKPGPIVTYSRKVFLNLINLCRDTCLYCTYKKEVSDPRLSMMNPDAVLAVAEQGKRFRCTEALIVTGERPEERYAEARQWLRSRGHSNLIDYISEISHLILDKTGLLPHTNAGSLEKSELEILKDSNVSVGVMLESSSDRLREKGMPHAGAPSKDPKVRIKTLNAAGELNIPTTTGLLVGIGETPEELVSSLFTLKSLAEKYGHIQEVIMQNFAPKPRTGMSDSFAPTFEYFIRAVALARILLPHTNIQVPPNLSPDIYGRYLDAGINDWGGISPVTVDYVNPEFAWPDIDEVAMVSRSHGKILRGRLPIYPEFIKGGFISNQLQVHVGLLSDESGLVREDGHSNGT